MFVFILNVSIFDSILWISNFFSYYLCFKIRKKPKYHCFNKIGKSCFIINFKIYMFKVKFIKLRRNWRNPWVECSNHGLGRNIFVNLLVPKYTKINLLRFLTWVGSPKKIVCSSTVVKVLPTLCLSYFSKGLSWTQINIFSWHYSFLVLSQFLGFFYFP